MRQDHQTGRQAGDHPALASYRRRNRSRLRIYAAVIAVLVAVALSLVKIAYLRGEITHVTKASAPAPAVPVVAGPAGALTLKWRSADSPAAGDPYYAGIVVTYSAHTVSGRDALTGAVRWHYTRSDETICTVAQQDGSTIAFYDRHGNCDEVTGFATPTGIPTFYKTIPDNGRPSISTASNVVLVLTPAAVHVFDNAGGIDRWTWTPPSGCTSDHALIGDQGVLISSTCGATHRLTLHQLTGSDETWTVAPQSALTPLTADTVISALDPATGIATVYDASKGAVAGQFRLGIPGRLAQPGSAAAAAALSATDAKQTTRELVWLDQLSAVTKPGRVSWTAPAAGPPTLTAQGLLAVVDAARVLLLDPATGRQSGVVTLSPSAGTLARAFGLGAGFVIAASDTAYYGPAS